MSEIDEDFLKEEEEEDSERIVIRSDTDEELVSLTKDISTRLQKTNENSTQEIEEEEEEILKEENCPPNSDSNFNSNSMTLTNSNSNLNEKIKTPKLIISNPELSESFHPPLSPTPLIPISRYSSPTSLSLQHYDNFDIRPVLITLVKSPLDSTIDRENKMPPLNNHHAYTDSTKEKQRKNSKRSKSLQRSSKTKRNSDYNEPEKTEVKEALELFIKKDQIPEPGIRLDVISLARRETVDATLNEDYDRANDLKRAIDVITQIMQRDKANFSDANMTNELKGRLEEAKLSQKEIESHYDEIINQQKDEEMHRREQLQQTHDDEIQRFQEYWQSPEAMIPFAKPSVELLQIRKMQKAYAIAHDFTGAKMMKTKAESLQKIETQEAQKRAFTTMKIEYEQLLEKHRKETEVGEMNWQRKLETLEKAKKDALKANENLARQLTLKIEGPKREKRKSVMLPIIEKRETIYTNKMRKIYAEYKKCPEKMRLELKMDSQSIFKSKTRSGKTPRKRNYE